MKKLIFLGIIFFSLTLSATEKWTIHEISLKGPKSGNPYTDVELSAVFTFKNRQYFVEGFYDGNGIYRIRFMPDEVGKWTYITQSNAEQMNGMTGSFKCTPASKGNHGPVKVRETFHFGYSDGIPFYPLGTTAYAWVHQSPELIEQTLETLSETAFNKIRMTVMPKHFSRFINNEPQLYPFEGSKEDGWDFSRFNPEYFQHFENQVMELQELGIEADIILFHPYDYGKWGLNEGTVEDNIHYLRYLVARLASYRNVWWSMANEYDMMKKPDEEWEAYFRVLETYDPYQHLVSIHNGMKWYDHSKPWITHLSVQTPYNQDLQDWRELYQKPVINDEFVYEGNIPYDWGNLTPEETVNRFWIIYCRGGYASHGETYEHPDNILWWSKGGKLYGKSPERLAFFYEIMKEAPETGLMPFHNEWNKETYLYRNKDYYLHYFGNSQQASAELNLPGEKEYSLEVIDAWNMSIEKLEGSFSGPTTIPLPGKPYMAVRARAND